MKRMLLLAVVSAVAAVGVSAVPAQAQTDSAAADIAAPCRTGEPVGTCAKRILATLVDVGGPCGSTEPLDTCIIRIARGLPDYAFDQAEAALWLAGYYAGYAIDQAEAACERYLSGCAAVPLP